MLDKNLMVAIGLGNLNNIELFTTHQTPQKKLGGRFGRLDVMPFLFSTTNSWVEICLSICFQFFGPLIFEKSVGLGRSRHGATPLLGVTGVGMFHAIVMCKRHAVFHVVPKLYLGFLQPKAEIGDFWSDLFTPKSPAWIAFKTINK